MGENRLFFFWKKKLLFVIERKKELFKKESFSMTLSPPAPHTEVELLIADLFALVHSPHSTSASREAMLLGVFALAPQLPSFSQHLNRIDILSRWHANPAMRAHARRALQPFRSEACGFQRRENAPAP